MKKKIFLFYVGLIWIKTLYGLVFFPYVTTRQIIRRPILAPVVLTPFLSLFVLFLFGRFGAVLLDVYGLSRDFIALFLSTILLSILFWQGLLLYFVISVWASFRK